MQTRRRRRTRTKPQRSGALIGEGAYGCGFFPGLRCAGNTKSYGAYISKYVSVRTANEELAAVEPLRTLDPDMNYTIYPLAGCEVAQQTPDEQRENPLYKCTQVSPETGVILQIPHGGESLATYMPASIPAYVPFFESLTNLFEGLSRLHDGGFAHLDIKLPNIVTNGTQTRYIDFGLGVTMEALAAITSYKSSVYAHAYYAWPYETRFLWKDFNKTYITPDSVSSFIRNVFQYKPEFLPAGIYTDPTGKPKFTYRDALEMWGMYQSLPVDDRLRHLAMATDIYSLGYSLASLYAAITGHFSGHGDNIYFLYMESKRVPYNHRETTVWESRMGTRAYMWHLELAEEVSIPFYTLCRQMMSVLPFNRPEAADALRTFRSLLPTLRRLFGKTEDAQKALGLFFKYLDPQPQVQASAPPLSPLNTAFLSSVKVPSSKSSSVPPPFSTNNVPVSKSVASVPVRKDTMRSRRRV